MLFGLFGKKQEQPSVRFHDRTYAHKLGMKEEEAIEHALISKSLANAQDKIAKKVTAALPAGSQREWLKRNVKEEL